MSEEAEEADTRWMLQQTVGGIGKLDTLTSLAGFIFWLIPYIVLSVTVPLGVLALPLFMLTVLLGASTGAAVDKYRQGRLAARLYPTQVAALVARGRIMFHDSKALPPTLGGPIRTQINGVTGDLLGYLITPHEAGDQMRKIEQSMVEAQRQHNRRLEAGDVPKAMRDAIEAARNEEFRPDLYGYAELGLGTRRELEQGPLQIHVGDGRDSAVARGAQEAGEATDPERTGGG